MLPAYATFLILVSLRLATGAPHVSTRTVAASVSNDALHFSNANTNLSEIDPSLSVPKKTKQYGHCAPDTGVWFVAEWRSSDCSGAFHELLVTDRRIFGNETFELVSPGSGVYPSRQHPYVWAPKRYEFETCTVMVANVHRMIQLFGQSALPGIKGSQLPPRDITSYEEIYTASKKMSSSCLKKAQPGWVQIGLNDAVGVFMCPTSSVMNERAGRYPSTVADTFAASPNDNGTTQ